MSTINDLCDLFSADFDDDKLVHVSEIGPATTFVGGGLWMIVTHSCNKLLGAIMTDYAYNILRTSDCPEGMNMAECAWAFGFGHTICFDDDDRPSHQVLMAWHNAMNNGYKFTELNRVAQVKKDSTVKYVVHMKQELKYEDDVLYLVGVAESLTELNELYSVLRATNAYNSNYHTLIINPVVKASFSIREMIVVE